MHTIRTILETTRGTGKRKKWPFEWQVNYVELTEAALSDDL